MAAWVGRSDWAAFLADDPATRSCTSICLKVKEASFAALPKPRQAELLKRMTSLLEAEGVALDIGAYRSAPPGLRIWGGATIDRGDVEALLPWLDWAYASVRAEAA